MYCMWRTLSTCFVKLVKSALTFKTRIFCIHTAVKEAGGYTLGSFTSSRFILAHLAMITSEHGAVDLSLLLSNGLMGLTQSVVRLAGKL